MSNSVVPDPYRSYNTVYSLVNCIPVNPLYYKTVMGDVTIVRHTNASWTFLHPRHTKGELITPIELRERVVGVSAWRLFQMKNLVNSIMDYYSFIQQ